jgi:hypothetical protein
VKIENTMLNEEWGKDVSIMVCRLTNDRREARLGGIAP